MVPLLTRHEMFVMTKLSPRCRSHDLAMHSRPAPCFSGDYGMEVRLESHCPARIGTLNALRMMKGVTMSLVATEEWVGSWGSFSWAQLSCVQLNSVRARLRW